MRRRAIQFRFRMKMRGNYLQKQSEQPTQSINQLIAYPLRKELHVHVCICLQDDGSLAVS